jgi:hypothetical protein
VQNAVDYGSRSRPRKMAVDVIDQRIPVDEVWQQAEKKDRETRP